MSPFTRALLGFALVAVIVGVSSSSAQAQYYYQRPPRYGYYPPPPPALRYRSALVVGFGVGGGSISTDNCAPGYCGGALSGEFHIGGMLTERLALEGDVWGNIKGIENQNGTFSQSFWSAVVQFWPIEPLWLKGGLGIAHVQASDDFAGVVYDDETSLGIVLAAGVELLKVNNFALDLQLRFGHATYSGGLNNYALLLGFNWY